MILDRLAAEKGVGDRVEGVGHIKKQTGCRLICDPSVLRNETAKPDALNG